MGEIEGNIEQMDVNYVEEEIEVVDMALDIVLEPGASRKGKKKKNYSIDYKLSCIDFWLRNHKNLGYTARNKGVPRSCLQDWI